MQKSSIIKLILIVVVFGSGWFFLSQPSGQNPLSISKKNRYEQEILKYEKALLLVIDKNKKENLDSVTEHISQVKIELKSARSKLEELNHTESYHRDNVKMDLEFHLEHARAYLKMANYPFNSYTNK